MTKQAFWQVWSDTAPEDAPEEPWNPGHDEGGAAEADAEDAARPTKSHRRGDAAEQAPGRQSPREARR
jgi:hypothetical protein